MNERIDRSGNGRRSADVLVLGAGVAGLTAAWRAAEGGARTLLLDPGDARPPASAVAAGMIAPVGEASWGEERLLAAARTAADGWPGFAERLATAAGLSVPYRRCGSVHVALDADEAAELSRRAELHERLELRSERLLGSECRRLEPALATAVVGGISAPEEAEIDPRALLEALHAAARHAGVELLAGRAVRVERDGLVELADGERLDAGRVVIAAGAWSGERGLTDRSPLPIRPVKGEIVRLRTRPGERLCERIIVGERFYVVPRANGEVVLGATVLERGFDLGVSAGGVLDLLREAYRALPDLAELELVETAVGLRPGSPDNAPLIGELEGGRLLVATGLHRNGILLAPLLADCFDALLADRKPPAQLAGFGPDRFAPRSADR